jgi:hypothetical protein
MIITYKAKIMTMKIIKDMKKNTLHDLFVLPRVSFANFQRSGQCLSIMKYSFKLAYTLDMPSNFIEERYTLFSDIIQLPLKSLHRQEKKPVFSDSFHQSRKLGYYV